MTQVPLQVQPHGCADGTFHVPLPDGLAQETVERARMDIASIDGVSQAVSIDGNLIELHVEDEDAVGRVEDTVRELELHVEDVEDEDAVRELVTSIK